MKQHKIVSCSSILRVEHLRWATVKLSESGLPPILLWKASSWEMPLPNWKVGIPAAGSQPETWGQHRHMAQMEDFLFPSGQQLNLLWGQANDSSIDAGSQQRLQRNYYCAIIRSLCICLVSDTWWCLRVNRSLNPSFNALTLIILSMC